jgi:hypothetical protein
MKERRKPYKINFIPIISMTAGLAVFSLILFFALSEASKNAKPSNRLLPENINGAAVTTEGSKDTPVYDSELLAIVKDLDTEGKKITLYDTARTEELVFSYTGGTDVTDKYGQIITVGQLPIGTMVKAGYLKEGNKLVKLQASMDTWEYIGVNNLSIYPADHIMSIGQQKYKYTDDILVINDGTYIGVGDLAEQDELTVRGYEETIWSITVTRGHGTVKVTDPGAFLGGYITIGYEAVQQITEDMILTVREGNFNLSVENGKYSATKNITVTRDQETVVSLNGLGPEAEKHGMVTFDINPLGADLFIDKVLTNYANPIELAYGVHELEVSLGGYTTYTGKLNVDVAGKKIKISLPEEKSSKPAEVEETGDSTATPVTTKTPVEYPEWNIPATDTSEDDSGEVTEEEYLVDEDHMIYVQYPTGASVYMNGDYLGVSPGRFPKVIGSQVLTFIRDGYETQSYTIDVPDDGLDMYLSLPDLTALSD